MFYVLDENNNKIEALDKEGVLALLEAAIENGSLENVVSDSAFVDKLKCSVNGGTFHVAFVTQAKYNELLAANQLITDCIYYITDDTTCDDLDAVLQTINNSINNLDERTASLEDKTKREIIKPISNITVELGKTYTFIVQHTTFIVALPDDIPLSEMIYSETDHDYHYIINSCVSSDGYKIECTIYKNANGELLNYSGFKLLKNSVAQAWGTYYYYISI